MKTVIFSFIVLFLLLMLCSCGSTKFKSSDTFGKAIFKDLWISDTCCRENRPLACDLFLNHQEYFIGFDTVELFNYLGSADHIRIMNNGSWRMFYYVCGRPKNGSGSCERVSDLLYLEFDENQNFIQAILFYIPDESTLRYQPLPRISYQTDGNGLYYPPWISVNE